MEEKQNYNFQIYNEHLKTYNKAVKHTRNTYFSKIIKDNKNNPKVLFSTIDHILNPDFNTFHLPPTDAVCEQFASHFMGKINTIRCDILSSHTFVFNTSELFYLTKH